MGHSSREQTGLIKTLTAAGLDAKGDIWKPDAHASETRNAAEADAALFVTAPQIA